jgi:two-component system, NtrC family, nitrogen regulation response regulator GlnG
MSGTVIHMTQAAQPSSATVLIVDDDAAVCWALEQVLKQHHYQVLVAADAAIARRLLRRHRPDLVITDVRMPGESGLDLLSALRADHPQIPVVVSTAYGTMDVAVEAVRRGAFDYLPKPLDLDRTMALVRRALGEDALAAAAQPTSAGKNLDGEIVGATPAMQEVYRRIAAAASTDMGVLICGDSGTGKELVARALHRYSKRRDGPFIAVNCGALPESLMESELFGHEAGAVVDARARKIGRVEAAHGGTLFLDEIGELSPLVQIKLLRFLDEQKFIRVGSEQDVQVDVRVIAATNRDISKMTTTGTFREDLWYRLRAVTITMPRLIDRLDDLPALIRHILARAAQRLGRPLALTDEAMDTLRRHQWPGNIRELKHVLEEAAVLATGGIIGSSHLSLPTAVADGPAYSSYHAAAANLVARLINQHPGAVYQKYYDAVEEPLLREVLARTEGNQLRAAELLGINRITLKKRMDELGINRG